MRAKEFLAELKIDNVKGIGAVPYNSDVDYFGLKVLMKPSTFLALALPLQNSEQDKLTIKDISQHINEPGFGAPFLQIEIPEAWESGDLSKPAKVYSHDGRHRMAAIIATEGDHPVEVHLFPLGLRRRHLTPEWIRALNSELISQRRQYVRGPFFKEPVMNEELEQYLSQFDEDFAGPAKAGSRPGSIKRKAAAYLGKGEGSKLSQTDLKRLRAKANKMKTSDNKATRARGIQLSRQVSWYNNFHK
jgi:hypothetical protein